MGQGERMEQIRPTVTVLYHYFYPDDVVSARHFEDFCQGLAARGWQVEAMPCNRGCRDESKVYPLREQWNEIAIHRVWRPRLKQASTIGRLVNASWMIAAWATRLVLRPRKRKPDVLVVGTDPLFSVLVARVVRMFRPSIRIVHWCYDLHPEASVAEGTLSEKSIAVRLVRRLLRSAYRSCDLVADLGGCMRALLNRYGHTCRKVTLVPWALAEPPEALVADADTRKDLFGEASLGLLYSGNFGRAHGYEEFLELARQLRGESIQFCFAVRGNQVDELRAAVRSDDTNVGFAGFAPEAELAKRLGAADIHLVSLRPSWTGVVVPSKFFGCLAAGRPVLFAGSRSAAIARWIEEFGVGWVLDQQSIPQVAQKLHRLAQSKDELAALQKRCHEIYQAHFSREHIMDRWDEELRALISDREPRMTDSEPRIHCNGQVKIRKEDDTALLTT
jgi:glycosyltransferase involved in cell wall biosynthesis